MTTIDREEALDIATWYDRMGRFIEGLNEGDGGAGRHIRKAYHLLSLAPYALRPMMAPPVEEAKLEAMLECGAFESAVASLIGKTGHVTVSNGDNDPAIEIRMRVEPSTDGSSTIETWPMAMLEAWAVSFQRLRPLPH